MAKLNSVSSLIVRSEGHSTNGVTIFKHVNNDRIFKYDPFEIFWLVDHNLFNNLPNQSQFYVIDDAERASAGARETIYV
jgi:hypothetical protein